MVSEHEKYSKYVHSEPIPDCVGPCHVFQVHSRILSFWSFAYFMIDNNLTYVFQVDQAFGRDNGWKQVADFYGD